MSLRFRKSFKVAPGVRINISKKSAGVSFGGKGFRKSINSSGRVTTSIGTPGTGVSYVSTKNIGSKSNKSYSNNSNSPHVHNVSTKSNRNYTENTANTKEIYSKTTQQKKRQRKAIAMFKDKPGTSYIIISVALLIFALSVPNSSTNPIAMIIGFFCMYRIYKYIACKLHPENPKYITDEQLANWGKLVDSNKKRVRQLKKASVPILIDLKERVENYYKQLRYATSIDDIKKCSELLLNTQNKIVELSEFVILKGDEPEKDLKKYSSLIGEVK